MSAVDILLMLKFPSFRCFDMLLASLLTNLLVSSSFAMWKYPNSCEIIFTILHLCSPSVIQESPLPDIFLEDLLEGRSHQPLQQLWSRRVSGAVCGALPALRHVLQRLLRRDGPGLRLLPLWRLRWARHVPYVLSNRDWEFWGGWCWKGLKNLEEGSMDETSKTRRFV